MDNIVVVEIVGGRGNILFKPENIDVYKIDYDALPDYRCPACGDMLEENLYCPNCDWNFDENDDTLAFVKHYLEQHK
jgi:hypothetical protein